MIAQLINDAKATYAAGVNPVRRTRGTETSACLVRASLLKNKVPSHVKFNDWLRDHYGICWNQGQGLMDGWDNTPPQQSSPGYLEGYLAGKKAALEILGD